MLLRLTSIRGMPIRGKVETKNNLSPNSGSINTRSTEKLATCKVIIRALLCGTFKLARQWSEKKIRLLAFEEHTKGSTFEIVEGIFEEDMKWNDSVKVQENWGSHGTGSSHRQRQTIESKKIIFKERTLSRWQFEENSKGRKQNIKTNKPNEGSKTPEPSDSAWAERLGQGRAPARPGKAGLGAMLRSLLSSMNTLLRCLLDLVPKIF